MSATRTAISGAVISIFVCTAAPSRAGDGDTGPTNVIEFVTRPKNSNGQVVCALFDQRGWLTTPVKPAWAKIRSNVAVCVFNDVKPGTYGISAYHDENKNGKLDTNLVGMPTEDYCASRDARETFSAPSFEKAKFAYSGGKLRIGATLK
jgi:uncharacterized protein (DUF2141 family)